MASVLRRLKLSLQLKFFLGIVVVIAPVLGIIFTWAGVRAERNAEARVLNQARVLARQIVMTRQWVSDCGGVFVDRNSRGARGTDYFYDDRVRLARGVLQRFTPSMVTTKLSDYSLRENLYRFRLTSLTPINPDNRPNGFERGALNAFKGRDVGEVYRFDADSANRRFQYAVPLFLDTSCLECHKAQGRPGAIGGCLSIYFPADRLATMFRSDHARLAAAGLVIILLTVLTLFFLLRSVVIKPLNRLKNMANEISDGNLNVRIRMESGDEFQELARTFNNMGERLSRNREIMEERIARATRDLSEANRDLQQLDRMKTEFFADMSHELRSPITAIQGCVDYLKRTVDDPDRRNYLAIMEKNTLRLVHLVSDLFDLTKIEAGKVDWRFEPADLSELVEEVVEILTVSAEEKQVRLVPALSGPVPVEMDLERIEQVLVNLIENAIKFSGAGSTVTIAVRDEQGRVSVAVADQGEGIPPEDMETIFRKFHTLPSGRRGRRGGNGGQGTGLGLTICRKIVEAHGGRIRVESEEGEGSVFTVVLPKNRNGEKPPAPGF